MSQKLFLFFLFFLVDSLAIIAYIYKYEVRVAMTADQ